MALSSGKLRVNMSAKASLTSGIGVSASDTIFQHSLPMTRTFPDTTALPATVVGSFALTLSSSTAFIDLTAVPVGNGLTSDATGLKLQCLQVQNRAGNGNLTLSYGTSSPYSFAGTSWSNVVQGHATHRGIYLQSCPEGAGDVSTAAKNILCTGTGTESFDVMVILG